MVKVTARWWCRACRAKGHDGPPGAAAHMDLAHPAPSYFSTSAQTPFGFTGYVPRDHNRPALNQPWAQR